MLSAGRFGGVLHSSINQGAGQQIPAISHHGSGGAGEGEFDHTVIGSIGAKQPVDNLANHLAPGGSKVGRGVSGNGDFQEVFIENRHESFALEPAEVVDISADTSEEGAIDLIRLVGGAEINDEFIFEFMSRGIEPLQGGGQDAIINRVMAPRPRARPSISSMIAMTGR